LRSQGGGFLSKEKDVRLLTRNYGEEEARKKGRGPYQAGTKRWGDTQKTRPGVFSRRSKKRDEKRPHDLVGPGLGKKSLKRDEREKDLKSQMTGRQELKELSGRVVNGLYENLKL